MKKVIIDASKKYEVIIGEGLLAKAGEFIANATGRGNSHGKVNASAAKAVILSDDNVFPIYGAELKQSLKRVGFATLEYIIPHGEQSKSMNSYEEALNLMCSAHVTRSDILIGLGGGVVGDLAGFAAATYQRGIDFVQIPTTVLAAVDSSVGGKTAINLEMGKNQAGAFYQPELVICDTGTLKTLPEEEYRNGCAEIIKYAMIGNCNKASNKTLGKAGSMKSETDGVSLPLKQGELLCKITDIPVRDNYEEIIAACVSMKRDYVVADEFDKGERMMLNFGHTIGHGVETCSDYAIKHGEAVAIGMLAMTSKATEFGICTGEVLENLKDVINKYGLPTGVPAFDRTKFLEVIANDKKNAGDTIRLVVPVESGKCILKEIPKSEISNWVAANI